MVSLTVDVCDVPIVSAAVAECSSCMFLLLQLMSLLNVSVFSTVADFPTVFSEGSDAVDIHDVPIVPAAELSGPALFDLPA